MFLCLNMFELMTMPLYGVKLQYLLMSYEYNCMLILRKRLRKVKDKFKKVSYTMGPG